MASWLKRKSGSDPTIPLDAPLDSLRFVVIDTELTSLEKRTNRLLSIGAIGMRGTSIVLGEQFYRIVNPQIAIPADTVIIHQIRSHDVEGAAETSRTLDEFSRFVAGAVLVGHCATIDLQVLRKEMSQTGHRLKSPAIDTARIHQWVLRHEPHSEDLPLQLEKLDLPTLVRYYDIEAENAHHALSDAFATARLWQKMFLRLQKHGVNNVRKLLKVGRV